MSRTPYIYIEKYDREKDKWEKLKAFKQDKNKSFIEVEVWPWNGTHEIFEFLQEEGLGADYGVGGLLLNTSEEIKQEYDKLLDSLNANGLMSNLQAFTYSISDIQLAINDRPEVEDFDGAPLDEDPPLKPNPLIGFLDAIKTYIEIADDYWITVPLSFYRVVGWIT